MSASWLQRVAAFITRDTWSDCPICSKGFWRSEVAYAPIALMLSPTDGKVVCNRPVCRKAAVLLNNGHGWTSIAMEDRLASGKDGSNLLELMRRDPAVQAQVDRQRLPPVLREMADKTGLSFDPDSVSFTPDGDGYAIASYPLQKDHWALRPGDNVPPMRLLVGTSEESAEARQWWTDVITEAGRYAYRASTMNGAEPDLDPDALLQNLVVAFVGYHTSTGLSGDAWANPEHYRSASTSPKPAAYPDNEGAEAVLEYLRACCRSHAGNARVLGNLRARDAVRALDVAIDRLTKFSDPSRASRERGADDGK